MDFFSCDSFLLLRVIVSFASSESLYTGLFLYRLSYFNFIFSYNRILMFAVSQVLQTWMKCEPVAGKDEIKI